jgi:hypothetical protein
VWAAADGAYQLVWTELPEHVTSQDKVLVDGLHAIGDSFLRGFSWAGLNVYLKVIAVDCKEGCHAGGATLCIVVAELGKWE